MVSYVPHMRPVDSSAIRAIGYVEPSSELFIRFNSGQLYDYFAVPRPVHEAFLSAPSKGRFFHERIDGVYRFEKISPS